MDILHLVHMINQLKYGNYEIIKLFNKFGLTLNIIFKISITYKLNSSFNIL